MIDRIACGAANLVGPRTNSIIPLSKIRARAFSLRSVGRRCVGLRGDDEPGACAADELARGDRHPRRADGLRAGVDGHLSPRPARAEPGPGRVGLGDPAHAHRLPVRAGRGPAAGRAGERRARAPASAPGGPRGLHARLPALRGRSRRLVADRRAAAAGRGRSRGHRDRAGDRARPALRGLAGALLRGAHARERARADPRADRGRPAAPRDRLARGLPRARWARARPARGRRPAAPRDAPAGAPAPRRARHHPPRVPRAALGPALRGLRALLRARLRGDVRLHRGVPVRAPGHPRALGAGLQPRVRVERGRDHAHERR